MSIENDNPVDADISDLYRAAKGDEGPGAALDAAILAEAEAATKPRVARPAWLAPVGLAATVLLGVNLAVNLKDYTSEPDVYLETDTVLSEKKSPQTADPELADGVFNAPLDSVSEHSSDVDSAPTNSSNSEHRSPGNQFADKEAVETNREISSLSIEPVAPQASPRPEPSQTKSDIAESTIKRRSPVEVDSEIETELESHAGRSYDRVTQQQADAIADSARSESENLARLKLRAPVPETIQKMAKPGGNNTLQHPRNRTASGQGTVAASAGDDSSRVETNATANETDRQIANTREQSAPESSQDKSAQRQAPAVASTVNDARAEPAPVPVSVPAPRPISAPAPDATARADATNNGSDLEEVIVSGVQWSDRDDSPHRRLTAKDQVAKTNRQLTRNVLSAGSPPNPATAAAAPPSDKTERYYCDMTVLKINDDAIEKAKTDALTLEPPLDAVSWPEYIRELTENHDFVTACAHLAAFRRIFPEVILVNPLRVTLPAEVER